METPGTNPNSPGSFVNPRPVSEDRTVVGEED